MMMHGTLNTYEATVAYVIQHVDGIKLHLQISVCYVILNIAKLVPMTLNSNKMQLGKTDM